MANSYWNFATRMVAGTLAKAADVNTNLDGVAAGFALVETDIDAISYTVADEAADTTTFVLFSADATGVLAPLSNAALTFNAFTGALGATLLTGDLTGDVTGDVTGNLTGNVTGNASGTALTVTQAAQPAITSVGTLTSLAVTGEVTGAGFTGTLDGILGGGTPAAATVTTLAVNGDVTTDADGTDSIGATAKRWLKGWFDSLTVTGDVGAATATITGEATALGFTGTLDGVLGGGTPAAVSGTTGTFSGDVGITGVLTVNEDTGLGAARVLIQADTTNPASVLFSDDAANRARITSTGAGDDLVLQTGASLTTALTLDSSQAATFAGAVGVNGDITTDADGTDSIGATAKRFLKGWFDSLTVTGDVGAATGTFTGTVDINDSVLGDALNIVSGNEQNTGIRCYTNYPTRTVPLVEIINDNATGSGVALQIQQDQSGPHIDLTGTNGEGIKFASSQLSTDVNTLDWYEEGTVTVTFSATSGTITIDSSFDTLEYTRIGNIVHVQGNLKVSAVSSPTGAWQIEGLKWAANVGTENSGVTRVPVTAYLLGLALTGTLHAEVGQTEDFITLLDIQDIGTVTNCADHCGTATQLFISMIYKV